MRNSLNPDEPPALRVGEGTALRVGEGTTLRVGEGTTLRVGEGTTLRVGEGTTLRVGEGTALRDENDNDAAQAKAAFFLRMRARGIQDLRVLRAFELIPRASFVDAAYRAMASRDVPVPLACGQTMPEPWLLARMIEALRVDTQHHVLEIGAGSGYATAILAAMAEDVIGIERFQTLALAAADRLRTLGISNAAVIWGDGLALPPGAKAFDRIIAHGIAADPGALVERLAADGVLVCGRLVARARHVVKIEKSGGSIKETLVCPCRLPPMIPGIAAAL
jgi:protein-L-isoaspartate(D-aspartate) O-methyltransferase